MTAIGNEIILEARHIVRRYPGTVALNDVTYRVYRNQVNVLIGENGAGKSTLMRILAGVEEPDEGQLVLDSVPIQLRSPRDAVRHGISIVHQELSVFPNLDLAENIFAGREPVKLGLLLDRATEDGRAAKAFRRLRTPMNTRTQAGYLSLGSRQLVEVARTLDQGARILILDEPTSALSNAEADSLFQVIADLKNSGVTIVYISHRLHELLHLGDQFTVLRSGRVVGEAPRDAVSRDWIVERMSGRDVGTEFVSGHSPGNSETVLRVEGLSLPASCGEDEFQAAITNVGFTLHKGEILGIYGLLGAGRSELLECLAGKRRVDGGRIMVNGVHAEISSVAHAAKHGIFLVPEDRQRDGLFPELSVRENITLRARKRSLLDFKEETNRARQIATELNIAVSDLELPVAALSGGNQQKVLIARCLLRSPNILLLDEPTRGVDVGAKTEIYAILRHLATKGLSIVFTSSEIQEIQALADRALVLRQGKVAAELNQSELTDEALFTAASPLVNAAAPALSGGAIA
jgi:erythritol transport system ATP-binding protein